MVLYWSWREHLNSIALIFGSRQTCACAFIHLYLPLHLHPVMCAQSHKQTTATGARSKHLGKGEHISGNMGTVSSVTNGCISDSVHVSYQ